MKRRRRISSFSRPLSFCICLSRSTVLIKVKIKKKKPTQLSTLNHTQQHTSRPGRGQADNRSVAEARPRGLAVARSRDAASSSQRGPGRGRVASARRRVGAGGARPRLRRWCASFSSPRSRRADPRLAPTKNNRRQRHGPAKRQRRGSAADAKSPLRLLLMGRVEPPDCSTRLPRSRTI